MDKTHSAVVYFETVNDCRAAYEQLTRNGLGDYPVTVAALLNDQQLAERKTLQRARLSSDIVTQSINGRVTPLAAVPYDE
jgi:hypothetical protein